MGRFKKDEIVGIETAEKIFCMECAEKDAEFMNNLTADQILTEGMTNAEESICFCDECGKQL